MSATIMITKLEAARRQLRSAIKLWFSAADFVTIHTLAAAAYQIIHDLNRRNKGPRLLIDTKLVKDEYKTEFVNEIKSDSNTEQPKKKSGCPTNSTNSTEKIL